MSNIIDEIKKSYDLGRLIPFIGAGFSKNIEGYPSWEEFINLLESEIGESPGFFESNFGKDYLEATEYYVLKIGELKRPKGKPEEQFEKGKDELRLKIRDTFRPIEGTFDLVKWQLHDRLISAEKITQIFTTNWDHAIEITCEKKPGVAYHHIIFDDDFQEIYEKKENCKKNGDRYIQLLKYHGDYDEQTKIIACETDYYQRMTGFHSLDVKFKNDILYHDFLYLGYSFSDINVKYILFQMEILLGQIDKTFRPSIYYITTERVNNARNELLSKRKGLKIYYLFDILDKPYSFNSTINKELEFILTSDDRVIINKTGSIIYNEDELPKDNKHVKKIELEKSIDDFSKAYYEFYSKIIKESYNLIFNKIF